MKTETIAILLYLLTLAGMTGIVVVKKLELQQKTEQLYIQCMKETKGKGSCGILID
jgi:hypothetical protein